MVGKNVLDDHDDAHNVAMLSPGTILARHPLMLELGESHGPPALPLLVPSFVCHDVASASSSPPAGLVGW